MTTQGSDEPPPPTARGVPLWPATVALVVGALLLTLVSDSLTIGPSWLPLAVVAVLFVPLTIARRRGRHDWGRPLGMIGLGTMTVAVATSAVILIRQLVDGTVAAPSLLTGSAAIWAANLITFGLWYWEIDGGGPGKRRRDGHVSTDFLFPQLQVGDGTTSHGWWPDFIDYLFVAFNASTAFSPTDTLILSRRAKVLMMIQSTISIVTIVVIAGRAINALH